MKPLPMIFLLVMLLTAGCGSSPPTQALPPAPLPPEQIATAFINTTSYPTMQATQSNVDQTVSGFTVRLQRAWRDGKQVFADICYTLPDNSDWTIWSAEFDYSGEMVAQFGSTMLSKQAAQRCDELVFSVPPDADLSSASLTVQSLGAQPTQDEYCSSYLPKIQEALTQRGIAITLGCSGANGSESMQIITKPASMSQQDAEKLVYSDEFFTVKGPWTFPLSLGQ